MGSALSWYAPQRDHEQLAQAEVRVVEQAFWVCGSGAQRLAILCGDIMLFCEPCRIAKPHSGELAGHRRQRCPAFDDQPTPAHEVRQPRTAEEGPNLAHSVRRLASYVHCVLTGTKPSALPIEQPTEFELVINQRMARRLGIDLPPALLTRADEVIE